MSLIAYGKMDKKLFLILFLLIVYLIQSIVLYKSEENNTYVDDTLTEMESEIGPIILGIILHFKFKNKREKKNKYYKNFLYLLLLFLFRAIEECYNYVFLYFIPTQNTVDNLAFTINGLKLILVTIGTIFSLKYKYYIHHLIAMIIYTVLGICIDIILGYYSIISLDYVYIFIILLLVDVGEFCYMKYMMDKLYFRYIELIIYFSIMGIIAKICMIAALSIYEYKNDIDYAFRDIFGYMSYYFHETDVAIIIFYQILYFLIIKSIERLLIFLVLYYLRPNHMIIITNIYLIVYLLFSLENYKELYALIPFCFQILSLLFYYENLEFNFWGLNKNTVKNIQIREGVEDENNSRNSLHNQIELTEQYYIENAELGINDEESEDLKDNIKSNENDENCENDNNQKLN